MDTREEGALVRAVKYAVAVGVLAFILVVGVAACVPLDPARLAFGCEVVHQNETFQTHSVPLQDAQLSNGRTNPSSMSPGAPRRYDPVPDTGGNSPEPVKHARDASNDCADPPLVCTEPDYLACVGK